MRYAVFALVALAIGIAAGDGAAQDRVSLIDTHAHPVRSEGGAAAMGRNTRGQSRAGPGVASMLPEILARMDEHGVELTILLPPPFPPHHEGVYGRSELAALVRRGGGRLAFVAGGEALNAMLQASPPDGVTAAALQAFRAEAEAVAAAGAAGFGELAVEHFSSGRGAHPYESTRPDHPLLLALADIGARHGMPLDIHMEAVPADMPFPSRRQRPGSPDRLRENIAAFERLLGHNRDARIVWAHAGWDLTGERNPALMRRLLRSHPNLVMSLKSDGSGARRTAPLTEQSTLRPEWLALLRQFPDRFVIGSDQFFDEAMGRLPMARQIVDALPPDIARQVAVENARRIYRLSR